MDGWRQWQWPHLKWSRVSTKTFPTGRVTAPALSKPVLLRPRSLPAAADLTDPTNSSRCYAPEGVPQPIHPDVNFDHLMPGRSYSMYLIVSFIILQILDVHHRLDVPSERAVCDSVVAGADFALLHVLHD